MIEMGTSHNDPAAPMNTHAEYFSRNIGALTQAQQESIRQSRVAVIGCGGLGGYVAEELVRIGLGRLHVFDPDVFSPSNCNRQLLALKATMGLNKAEMAAKRATLIHPLSKVLSYPVDFREAEADTALQVDVVVDCLDDIPTRRDLADLCIARQLPLVHGSVYEWYGQVGVQLPDTDLMARLYPDRSVRQVQKSPSVLAFTAAVVASLQVCEAVKLLLKLPSTLHNSCLHVDLKNCEFQLLG